MSKPVNEDNFLKRIKELQQEVCCIQAEIDSIIAGNVDLVIDVTEVTDATDTYLLYNNAGLLGELDPATFLHTDGSVNSTALQTFDIGINVPDGTAASPSILLGSGGDTGIYRSGSSVAFSRAGSQVGAFNGSGLVVNNISELTGNTGVFVDGALLKDGRVGGYTQTATSNGTVTLTSSSTWNQEFTGSTQYQIVSLGDCTTYLLGKVFTIINNSTNIIIITDNAGTVKRRMLPEETTRFTCTSIGSSTGAWNVETAAKIRTLTKHLHWEEDFELNAITDSSFTNIANAGGGSGQGFTFVSTGMTSSRVGIGSLDLGTGTTARSTIHRGGISTFFGGGVHIYETYVYIPVLSTVTDEYIFYTGFGDTTGSGDMTDGVYFKYDRLTSTNWLMCTANNGAGNRTATSSGVAVAATTWTKLRFEVNAAGTRVDYFINDVNVGNISTNIPTTVARVSAPLAKAEKSAGTTSTSVLIDFISRDFIRTTSL